jgi:hypothetical protein
MESKEGGVEERRRREGGGKVRAQYNYTAIKTTVKNKNKSDIPFWAFSVITVSCDGGKKGGYP